jgi:acetolactate synthase-1/2/3 large subunit
MRESARRILLAMRPGSQRQLAVAGELAQLWPGEDDAWQVWRGKVDDLVHGKASTIEYRTKYMDQVAGSGNSVRHYGFSRGDAKAALRDLLPHVEKLPTEDWLVHLDGYKKKFPLTYKKQGGLRMQQVIDELYTLTKGKAIISTDVGQHQMWAAQFYKFRRPRTWLSSSGLGTMGFGLPAAMGAKVAHPDSLVVDIDGDGSILMNIQEFATCKTENIGVKILLLNNQHLGMVVQWEDRFFKGNRAHTYLGPVDHPEAAGQGDGISPESRYPDFVAIAKGFGWQAETVSAKNDLEGALRRLIDAPGPAILDVQVPDQEHVLPMIPSGMTVRELIKK